MNKINEILGIFDHLHVNIINKIQKVNWEKCHKRTYSQDKNRLKDFKTKLMVTKGETLGGGMN